VPGVDSANVLTARLRRRITQIVVRSHRRTIRTGLRDQQHVGFLCRRQAPVAAEHVARFADLPDNLYKSTCGFFQSGQVDDFMIRLVQRGRISEFIPASMPT